MTHELEAYNLFKDFVYSMWLFVGFLWLCLICCGVMVYKRYKKNKEEGEFLSEIKGGIEDADIKL